MTLPGRVADLVGRLSLRIRRWLLASALRKGETHESNRPAHDASVESCGRGVRLRWRTRRVRAVSRDGLRLSAVRLPDARCGVRKTRHVSRVRHDADSEAGIAAGRTERAVTGGLARQSRTAPNDRRPAARDTLSTPDLTSHAG